MAINIEITDSPEVPALAALHAAAFAQGWDEGAISGMLEIKGTMAFVAMGKGFGLLRYISGEAEILTLAVAEEYRRQGIGEAITSAMCGWARTQGAKAVFLEVRQSNAPAAALYAKSGFAALKPRKDYYRNADGSCEGALIMHYVL